MANGNGKDTWSIWWPRVLSVTGLAIIIFIVDQNRSVDPYLYPIIALMLGFPIAGWAEGLLRKGNGNGNENRNGKT